MIIKSCTKDYKVNIENDFSFLNGLKNENNKLFVIDKNLYEIYHKELFDDISKNDIYIIEALEENKTIETALELCEQMTEIPAKRNAHLISLGGGIIQDITGFVANVLYRGIKWTFVPTTLLAACDSCIGGKTSLNYKRYKNLLGTFYPPDQIFICSKFFRTLTERDFLSGLGEVVKFNVMYGEDGVSNIENNIDRLIARKEDVLDTFVNNSLLFKKDFIEEDEFDKGVRINLNFAHTFGHAFETVSNYAIPHGTAVAMGTLVADYISTLRGYMDEEMRNRIEEVLIKIIHIEYNIKEFEIDKIINAIKKDKKQINSNITAVLFDKNMKLKIYHNVEKEEISKALVYLFDKLGA